MIKLENISFDHCIKCTVCTLYCPVARATSAYPGPKQSGPDAERLRIKNPELVDDSVHFCNNCKRCEIACPSDVKIADIIQRAKCANAAGRTRPRDFILSRTDLLGRVSTSLAPVVNRILPTRPAKKLMDRLLGVPAECTLPKYETGTFSRRLRSLGPDQARYQKQAVYFHGCYVNYNDHRLGLDVVTVLNALGLGVRPADEVCCGVPLIANGFMDQARINARRNVSALIRASKGRPIVTASSTCAFALRFEYPNLLEVDNSAVADRIQYITRFISERWEEADQLRLKPVELTAAYHAPCHLERMGGVLHTVDLLRRIPGLRLHLLRTECCGIAGTYGFKKENRSIAQAVGREMVQRIEAVNPDVVITDCETCKWQIEMNTGRRVLHPITILASALARKENR